MYGKNIINILNISKKDEEYTEYWIKYYKLFRKPNVCY